MTSGLPPIAAGSLDVVSAYGGLLRPALEVLYAHLSPDDRAIAAAQFEQSLAERKIPADALLIACRGPVILGAILAIPQASATVSVFPPSLAGEPAEAIARALFRQLTRQFEAAGVRIAQCIRDPQDEILATWLERTGFYERGRILILEFAIGSEARARKPIPWDGLNWRPWSPAERADFAQIIDRCFVGSLDVPELTGFRSGREILEANPPPTSLESDLWRRYFFERPNTAAARDAGVLLMEADGVDSVLEIVYLGVVPEARGRGLGRGMVKEALSRAANLGLSRARVHVFASNTYARNVYKEVGFEERGATVLHLWTAGDVPAPAK